MAIRPALFLLLLTAAVPAWAQGASGGGDREPAGGAFNSSYTNPGSTGVQQGGPPRSADVPRAQGQPGETGSIREERREQPPTR